MSGAKKFSFRLLAVMTSIAIGGNVFMLWIIIDPWFVYDNVTITIVLVVMLVASFIVAEQIYKLAKSKDFIRVERNTIIEEGIVA